MEVEADLAYHRSHALPGAILVFGCRRDGRRTTGAAKYAYRYRGAVYGQAEGRMGQSYAIPVSSGGRPPTAARAVVDGIVRFLGYARRHPEWRLEVTPVGIGENEYAVAQLGCYEFEAYP